MLTNAICSGMQVPRASASAVAFGLGLLSGKGKLGPGKNRAFSVLSESRASDICLRFFDSCETYKVLLMVALTFVEKKYGSHVFVTSYLISLFRCAYPSSF
jgi:hypothetical protein